MRLPHLDNGTMAPQHRAMDDAYEVYQRLGVRPLINAKGPASRLSGGPMRPEVAGAMAAATQACVDVAALQGAASAMIAEVTGAEAGIVTSGAAAGLLLGAAACVTRLDPAAMARLPDTRGLRNQAVMARSQRNQYDHAIRAAGLRIVEVGLADRFAGAGVRDAEPWEIAAAFGERTALVHYVATPWSKPELEAVVEVAHAARVPVLVDAAAQLPPKANLRAFIDAGADLVVFSGGKAIGGPQASGILCGRRELVAAAALQMLDMDYPDGLADWPAAFGDLGALRGLPPHGIGRGCKVGKEQIVGLLTALDLFAHEDEAEDRSLWSGLLSEVQAGLEGWPVARVELRDGGAVPILVLAFASIEQARKVLVDLAQGEPGVALDPAELDTGRLLVDPVALRAEDLDPLLGRLWALAE